MGDLNTAPNDYDQTVSAYVTCTIKGEAKILLHWHKKLQIWLQPGGHIERNENAWQAVLREAKEETGYLDSQLTVMQPKMQQPTTTNSRNLPIPFNINSHRIPSDIGHFHNDLAFLFVSDQAPASQVAAGESDKLRWFSAAELQELESKQLFDDSKLICLQALELAKEWHPQAASSYTVLNP